MLFQRRLIIRASLFLNFCVLTYVALQAAQGGGNGSGGSVNLSGDPVSAQTVYGGETESSASTGGVPGAASAQPPLALPTETDTEVSTSTLEQANWSSDATNEPPPAELRIDCRQTEGGFAYTQRGQFWILNNYVRADKSFRCNESITYTTHGDVTFLDNVIPLVQRWDGPLSMAVYAPGTDYDTAMNSIAYLRQCTIPAVNERVTFHLVLDERHFPRAIRKLHPSQGSILVPEGHGTTGGQSTGPTSTTADANHKRTVQVHSSNGQAVIRVERSGMAAGSAADGGILPEIGGLPVVNCSQPAPWSTPPKKTYKQIKNLTYPVNVLRNVARQNAPTHYILASDAELYPSPNLVGDFFAMLRRNESILHLGRPKIFVLPIFEVYSNQTVPTSKAELLSKLQQGLAVPFHQKVCSYCHSLPKSKEWMTANISQGLHVFHIAKRHKPYQRWEPIYIGTQDDPLYDERLTWEGKSDKMTQGYALCMLDYDFMILDNAFLVHRPGVKIPRKEPVRDAMAKKQSAVIRSAIYRELKIMYGQNNDCIV